MSTSPENVYLELQSSNNANGYENTRLGLPKAQNEERYEEIKLDDSHVNESDDYDALRKPQRNESVNYETLRKTNDVIQTHTEQNSNEIVNKTMNEKVVNSHICSVEPLSLTSQTSRDRKWKILFAISFIICLGLIFALVFVSVQKSSTQDTKCNKELCLNGGSCFMVDSDFRCACPRGFYGRRCENTPCSNQPCINNGTCVVWQHTYNCSCVGGFAGAYCEATNLCFNNGVFNVNDNNFNCSCACGYFGDRCKDFRSVDSSESNYALIQDTCDDWDWRNHSGSTSSDRTGPFSAQEGSFYLYFEASLPVQTNSTARLILKPIKQENCLGFYYHMYGEQMGALIVYQESQKIWSRYGNQNNSWHSAKVTLEQSKRTISQIIFEAVRGDGYRSDIAIDNITLDSSYC